MKEDNDITQIIISDAAIRQRIGSIFPDSAILDNQLNFLSISQNILEATGYTRDELQGRSISLLSNASDIKALIEEKLRRGFFEEEPLEIRSKTGDTILYGVSGFYLGLIADVNGMIVLKFKNLDELNLMYDRLEAKTTELDRFVYLSAHGLRGPLATIKGLVNLTKLTDSQEEMSFLLNQIDSFTDKLDDKLHRLIYFAEADKGYESSVQSLMLQHVIDSLAANVEEGCFDHPVHFQCPQSDPLQLLENGEVILSLLRNLVLFFCQQPKRSENQILLDVHSNLCATEIVLRAKGFMLSDSLREKLSNTNFGYSEILNYPELINFYAAKKIVFRLRGDIQFILASANEVVVLITAYRNSQLSLS